VSEKFAVVPLREGMNAPVGAQIVYARPLGAGEHEVSDILDVPRLEHKGPARVAGTAYREGYDRVFGPEAN